MKYRFIEAHRRHYPVSLLCRVLQVRPSAYYAARRREMDPRQAQRRGEEEQLAGEIQRVFHQKKGRYGSPRVYWELRAQGRRCSRKRVARLMQKQGLMARRPRRHVHTTDSAHTLPVAENVLARRFDVTQIAGPNLFWCSDITYILTEEGWLYLAVVLDLFSRRVVGWSMSGSLAQDFVLDAFRMAVQARRPSPGLLHHSDRGSQYAGYAHRALLIQGQVVMSMSRKANCWDNAVLESFFATLKTELIHAQCFATRSQARAAVFEYIESFYNRERRHSTLGYRSPVEFEQLHEDSRIRLCA
jgi:transposase InsO family protein